MMDHNRRPQEGAPRGSLVIDAVIVVGLMCPTAVEIPRGENSAWITRFQALVFYQEIAEVFNCTEDDQNNGTEAQKDNEA